MWFLLWIALGLLTGIMAMMILPGNDRGSLLLTSGIGVSGAFCGGYAANMIGAGGVADFSLVSLVLASVASILVLLIFHRVRAQR
jgi:uncharacterized membrane protein YeaQ/YmgE (transglycosylase-associated protein family)